MKYKKEGALVWVEWEDATVENGWGTVDRAAEDREPALVHCVGWVISHDAKGIKAAAMTSPDYEDVNAVWFVPAGMISKIRSVREPS